MEKKFFHCGIYSGSFILIVFFFFFATVVEHCGGSPAGECIPETCGGDGDENNVNYGVIIRFPFWVKHRQPEHCGCPGFGLSCTHEGLILLDAPYLPPGTLIVNEIDYESRLINVLYNPDACLPRIALFPNYSSTVNVSPFQYDESPYYLRNVTLLNCSYSPLRSDAYSSLYLISCLSTSTHQVYGCDDDRNTARLPLSNCAKIGTPIRSIPDFMLPDESPYPFFLKWAEPNCEECRLMENSACHKPKHKLGAAAKRETEGIILGSFALLLIAIGVYYVHSIDRTEREHRARVEKFLDDYRALKPARYSYADIKKITHQFKDKLGEGGYGTVFKGKLSNEILVAVKILKITYGNGEEFLNEVGTMGRIHHVNVVRLVGFCADGFRRALVYEFLPNESLEKFIFSENLKKSLGWKKLKDISLGIAKGIEYLHQGCEQRILHFDIKPHNILLDQNFNPKISDFGLAKLCSKEQSAISLTSAGPRGTLGYIAPEVFSRNFGSVSHKSDVYSFGMLLLDMVERSKNTEENSISGYFPDWIYNRLERGEAIGSGIDSGGDANIAKQLTIVGLWCIQWYPVDRPSIKVVVQLLEGEGGSLIMPPNPFGSTSPMTASSTKQKSTFDIELPTISESELEN